jgi:hypothetical protein
MSKRPETIVVVFLDPSVNWIRPIVTIMSKEEYAVYLAQEIAKAEEPKWKRASLTRY